MKSVLYKHNLKKKNVWPESVTVRKIIAVNKMRIVSNVKTCIFFLFLYIRVTCVFTSKYQSGLDYSTA